MAYDERLADRIRDLIAAERDVDERRMFGGLAFLVGGHMAITASREGGILVRVDPEEADRLVAGGDATAAVMREREMRGWLRVEAARLRTGRQLATWVDRSVVFARRLPPKSAPKRSA